MNIIMCVFVKTDIHHSYSKSSAFYEYENKYEYKPIQ